MHGERGGVMVRVASFVRVRQRDTATPRRKLRGKPLGSFRQMEGKLFVGEP
jgi:hypothetical protein